MAQKKCPKCSENNPPEAVMCWACYTPLSRASAAVAAPSAVSFKVNRDSDSPQHETSETASVKKAVEPWQLGVIGIGVLLAVFMGGRSLMGSSSGKSVIESVSVLPPTVTPDSTSYSAPSAPAAAPIAMTQVAVAPAKPLPPGEMAFTISVPPSREVSWATIGIVPTQANTSPRAAAALAASLRQQLLGTGNWKGFYIYVFKDQESAMRLRAHQADRAGKPLDEKSYQTLRSVWPSALARYEYSAGWEAVRYPSANPTGWWEGQSRFAKAKL